MRRPCRSADAMPPAAAWGSRLETQHRLHVVQPVVLVFQEARGAQRALRVSDAAGRTMRDLDAFADAAERHGVVAHDVAARAPRSRWCRACARRCRRGGSRWRRPAAPRPRPRRWSRPSSARCPRARRPCCGDGPRTLRRHSPNSGCGRPCPAAGVAFTPTLMLGAKTMAVFWAATSMAARPASSKPVVPMTAFTPWRTQACRCSSVPSGRVKSIRQSAPDSASRLSVMATPVCLPSGAPASWPSEAESCGPAPPPVPGRRRRARLRSASGPCGRWRLRLQYACGNSWCQRSGSGALPGWPGYWVAGSTGAALSRFLASCSSFRRASSSFRRFSAFSSPWALGVLIW